MASPFPGLSCSPSDMARTTVATHLAVYPAHTARGPSVQVEAPFACSGAPYCSRPGIIQTPRVVVTASQHQVFRNKHFCAGFRSCWCSRCSNFPGRRAWSCPLVLSFMERSRAAAIAEFALEGGLEAVLGAQFCTKFHQSQNLPFLFSTNTFPYIQGW